jgi:hypothetical protein
MIVYPVPCDRVGSTTSGFADRRSTPSVWRCWIDRQSKKSKRKMAR